MKLSLLTKALLSALASTALLLLVFLYTQGGFGGASAGVVKKVLLPAGLGESRVTYGSDRTYGTDGTNNNNDDDQIADAAPKNDDENDHAQRGYYPAQRDDKQGAVLGQSTTTSSASSNSSTFPRPLTPPAKVLGDSISLQPSAVDFSSLGISEYQLNQLIAQQLTNLASIGLLGHSQGSSSLSSIPSTPSTLNPSPSLPAPVITYIQPAPAQNFSGASLLSATDLSSTRFTTTTANVTDTATIKTLSVTENANVAGDLDVSGSATIDGDITITGNITGNVIGTINPSFTLGSIPFQGASNLTQDNANLFWDNTNKRLGVGTSAPTAKLVVVGAGNTYLSVNPTTKQVAVGSYGSDTEMGGLLVDNANNEIYLRSNTGYVGIKQTNRVTQIGDYDGITSSGLITVSNCPGNVSTCYIHIDTKSAGNVSIGDVTGDDTDAVLNIRGTGDEGFFFERGNVVIGTTASSGALLQVQHPTYAEIAASANADYISGLFVGTEVYVGGATIDGANE